MASRCLWLTQRPSGVIGLEATTVLSIIVWLKQVVTVWELWLLNAHDGVSCAFAWVEAIPSNNAMLTH